MIEVDSRERPRFASAVVAALSALVVATIAFASPGAAQAADLPTLPTRIEAEAYEAGDEGVAFGDTDPNVGSFRPEDPVDAYVIHNVGASDQALLGRTRDGEFVTYTVNVEAPQEFDVRLRLANGSARLTVTPIAGSTGKPAALEPWPLKAASTS